MSCIIHCNTNSSNSDNNDNNGSFPTCVFSTIMFRSQGLMKCPENFLKSLRRGLFCVISISQQPNGTSHSLAALQLEGVRQNDFYRHRAEMFNRLTGWH